MRGASAHNVMTNQWAFKLPDFDLKRDHHWKRFSKCPYALHSIFCLVWPVFLHIFFTNFPFRPVLPIMRWGKRPVSLTFFSLRIPYVPPHLKRGSNFFHLTFCNLQRLHARSDWIKDNTCQYKLLRSGDRHDKELFRQCIPYITLWVL